MWFKRQESPLDKLARDIEAIRSRLVSDGEAFSSHVLLCDARAKEVQETVLTIKNIVTGGKWVIRLIAAGVAADLMAKVLAAVHVSWVP